MSERILRAAEPKLVVEEGPVRLLMLGPPALCRGRSFGDETEGGI